ERGAQPADLHLRRHRWTTMALAAAGALLAACLLPGALLPPLVVFVGLWFLNGAGQALIAVSSATLLAEHTRSDERGRAYAAHFAITHLWWLVTYPSVGWASARWGAPITFTALGALCAAIAVVGWLATPASTPAHDHLVE
ncbi:MAG: MFS transporter, partial [Polyangiaceae bacterium]